MPITDSFFIVVTSQVALKTLIVIHRALREVDPTFHEELINYGRSRNRMLNMAHFKDDSSPNGMQIINLFSCLQEVDHSDLLQY